MNSQVIKFIVQYSAVVELYCWVRFRIAGCMKLLEHWLQAAQWLVEGLQTLCTNQ